MASIHSDLPIVIDHVAKPRMGAGQAPDENWREGISALAALPNVWCKLSGMVTEADWARWSPTDIRPYIDEVLRIFGPARCMMGTDWPVSLLASDYKRTVDLVRNVIAKLPEADQQSILWNSAVTAYRLNVTQP